MELRSLPDFQLTPHKENLAKVELVPVTPKTLKTYKNKGTPALRQWIENAGVTAAPEQIVSKMNVRGALTGPVFLGIESKDGLVENPYDYMFALAPYKTQLGQGNYIVSPKLGLSDKQIENLLLGWGIASYKFDKYKAKKEPAKARVIVPSGVNKAELLRKLNATALVQDLINEPTNVMTPRKFEEDVLALTEAFGVSAKVIRGDQLLKHNFPLIHAVGRAADEKEAAPRLIDVLWNGPEDAEGDLPLITLVGKGVMFDTGGLDLKTDGSMKKMKYDMAGAAHALGLAYMIMDAQLPVRVRLLLPVVENMIGKNAYKPDDIIKSRKGDTIEIINTDAEGRLILADALHEAAYPVAGEVAKPELIIDYGTLGWFGEHNYPGYATFYPNNKSLARSFRHAVEGEQEHVVERLDFMRNHKEVMKVDLKSHVADLRHCSNDHACYDDLIAMSFLLHQVGTDIPWMHIDVQPWRDSIERVECPPNIALGGHAQGLRAAYAYIKDRFAPAVK